MGHPATVRAVVVPPPASTPRLSPPVNLSEVQATVRQLVARHAHAQGELVTMRRPLADLGVDLLALVAIVKSLETHSEVELDPDEILSWLTAADIAETVEATLGA
jgi:acyl carrier protein